jgi:superfamily II DNA or RNA helicase
MIQDFTKRPAQVELTLEINRAFETNKRLLAVASTGLGKTVVAAGLIADELLKLYPHIASGLTTDRWSNPDPRTFGAPKQILFVVHRDALVNQTLAKFKRVFASRVHHEGKRHERGMGDAITIVKSGKNYSPNAPIVVVSQQSLSMPKLKEMLVNKMLNVDAVIFDECHTTLTCKTGQDMMVILEDKISKMLGLTATPFWSDKEMVASRYFDAAVCSRPFKDLVRSKELCGYRYFEPDYPIVQTETYKDAYGKMRERTLDCKYETQGELEYAVEKFKQVAALTGMTAPKAIGFASDVAHGENIANVFTTLGIKSEVISYKNSTAERKEIFARFETGDTQLLVSVDALAVGYDFEEIIIVCVFSLTVSESRHWQRLGRGARTCTKIKKLLCYVIDYAKSVAYHNAKSGMGMPDLVELTPDIVMGLKPRKKREGVAPAKVCPKCDTINPISARVCQHKNETGESLCDHTFPTKDVAKHLQVIPGDLHRIYHPSMELDDVDRIQYFRSLRSKAWARGFNPNSAIVDYQVSEIGSGLPLPELSDFVNLREFTAGSITGKPDSLPSAYKLLNEALKLRKTRKSRWTKEVIYALIYLEFAESVAEEVNAYFLSSKLDSVEQFLLDFEYTENNS